MNSIGACPRTASVGPRTIRAAVTDAVAVARGLRQVADSVGAKLPIT